MKILISGAGIAGPSAAFWLERSGHEVTIVEVAPALREGGYIVDFWGIGYDIVERMGLLPEVLANGYQVKEVRYVNSDGERAGGFSTAAIEDATGGRFTSVKRSDLSRIIFGALNGRVETLFGNSIVSIDEDGESVEVEFATGPHRKFDLVIGCDGLHSAVRRLSNYQTDAEKFLGYYVAAFTARNYPHRNDLVYMMRGLAGKQVSRFSMRDNETLFLFVFRKDLLKGGEFPQGSEKQKDILRATFADSGWEIDDILSALDAAEDLYFDRVSQIKLGSWHTKRSVLVGDAAAAVSLLAGEGTGLAIAESYVLAGELSRDADVSTACENYQQRLYSFIREKQRSAASFASFFAPRTEFGVLLRDWSTSLLNYTWLAKPILKRTVQDNIELPDYKIGRSSQG